MSDPNLDREGGVSIFGGSPIVQGGECGDCGTTGGAFLSGLTDGNILGWVKSVVFTVAFICLALLMADVDPTVTGWLSFAGFLLYFVLDDVLKFVGGMI